MSQILIQNLDFTYDGDHTPVFERLNLQWDTDWKLGLVGRNGRGKTTLLRLLEGSLEGKGTMIRPERPLYVPKPIREPQRPARDVLMDGVPEEDEWKLLRELNKLGLGEELLDRPFDRLSGGEQTRARLAALFLQEDGYPMIDEPTNHLDEAGRALTARYLREPTSSLVAPRPSTMPDTLPPQSTRIRSHSSSSTSRSSPTRITATPFSFCWLSRP